MKVLCILAFCFISTSLASVERFTSNEELSASRAMEGPQAIFYYHYDESSQQKFKSRTVSILEEADIRFAEISTTQFMRLGMINCIGKGIITQDIPECIASGKRVFYAYRNNDKEKFSLKALYSVDAFVANMMFFVYQEDIGIVETMADWEYYQSEQRGRKDILFVYFKALGSTDHYNFMEFYHNNHKQYRFIFTNSESFVRDMGINESLPNVIWYAKCAALPAESLSPCPTDYFSEADANSEALYTFIKLQTLPLVSDMNTTSGSSIFSDIERLHILYLFVDNDEDKQTHRAMLENVIQKLGKGGKIIIRGVIADSRSIDENIKSRIGILKEMYPTAVLSLHDLQRSEKVVLEPFTPDVDVVEDSLYKFVWNLVKHRDEYYASIDEANYIECVKAADWKGSLSTTRKTLVGLCTNSRMDKTKCIIFKQMFRLLVRTMYAQSLLDYSYVYVDNSNKLKLPSVTSLPAIAFILPGKDMVVFDKSLDQMEYNQILQLVNTEMMLDLPILPYSGSDFLPLPVESKLDENNAEDLEDDEYELEKYQEDEVAKATMKLRNAEFYLDDTLALTDETFEAAVNDTVLLMVYFFTPTVDDISFLIQPVVASIAKKIEKDPVSNGVMTKIAKVNCEDEFRTCTEHVNKYPTIRFYSKGKCLGDYKGLLEEKSLLESIILYQQPALGKLTKDTILKYIGPTNSHTSILGWFESENEDFKVFEKVAEERRGKMQFAYATGEAARKLIPEISESSFVVAYIQNTVSGVFSGATDVFSKSGLDAFLKKTSIPKFGELTVSNFPTYKSFNQSMLVLFTASATKMDSVEWKSISQISKDNELRELVLFTWMNTDNSITKEIRRSYLGARKEQHDIVIVNHKKAEVYHYSGSLDNTDVSIKEISKWIRSSSGEDAKVISYLNTLNWKPLREGFDFLHLIDNNIQRASLDSTPDDSDSDKNPANSDQMKVDDGNRESSSFQRVKGAEGGEKYEEKKEEMVAGGPLDDENDNNEDMFIPSDMTSSTSSDRNKREEL